MIAVTDPWARFWSHVTRTDGCWSWAGFKLATGYGRVYCGKQFGHMMAHRASWVIHFGAIPDGMCVCHHCDNPECANPTHLFIGTHQDNMRDRNQKGRAARLGGERNGCALLKEADVRVIRSLWPLKSQSELARIYGVHLSTVHLIVHRRHWKDVV